MKLYAFDRKRLVPDAHDVAVLCACSHFEVRGKRAFIDDERVVARERSLLADDAEQSASVSVNFFDDTVAYEFSADDFCTERLSDCLMSQTDAENGNLAGEMPNRFD